MTTSIDFQNQARMFVIPNHSFDVTQDMSDWNKHIIDRLNKRYENMNIKFNGELVQAMTGDRLIDVWNHGLGSDNWQDHNCPIIDGYFPSYIPLRLLDGIKEGDILHLSIGGQEVDIICQQRGYRYERFGDFEDVVEMVTK